MTRTQFNTFVQQPDTLGTEEEADLRYSLTLYPYCQILHLMYAKCLNLQDDHGHHEVAIGYASEHALQKILSWQTLTEQVSPQEPDPATSPAPVLPSAVPEKKNEQKVEDEVPASTPSRPESTINEGFIEIKESKDAFVFTGEIIEREADQEEPTTQSFQEWLQTTRAEESGESTFLTPIRLDTGDTLPTEKSEDLERLYQASAYELQALQDDAIPKTSKEHSNELIDKFIETDPHITVKKGQEKPINNPVENKARQSGEFDLGIITETLAEIYVKQRLYSHAISAYEKLSLKFPEKSAYFAARVEKIKSSISSS